MYVVVVKFSWYNRSQGLGLARQTSSASRWLEQQGTKKGEPSLSPAVIKMWRAGWMEVQFNVETG